jgi:hypothetical protein
LIDAGESTFVFITSTSVTGVGAPGRDVCCGGGGGEALMV